MWSPSPGRRCWAARRRTACWCCARARWRGWRATRRPGRCRRLFRMTKGGKLDRGHLRGRDDQHALDAVRRGLSRRAAMGELARRPQGAVRARRRQRSRRSPTGSRARPGSTSWPAIRATRSNTSVCLKIVDPAVAALPAEAQAAFAKELASLLEKEKRRLRHRRLSRRAAGPAHLVRRDGRDVATSTR